MSVEVPEEWTERLGEDRIVVDGGGFADADVLGGFGGSFSTDYDDGELTFGVGIGNHVAIDLSYDEDDKDVSIGALARLSPEEARELAHHIEIAAQVVEESR
jgi:hypothetical protein